MYHVSAQGVDERMINVHYYYVACLMVCLCVCQIHVMELETDLEKERRKLGELRKQHYQLAGEAEGWEVVS